MTTEPITDPTDRPVLPSSPTGKRIAPYLWLLIPPFLWSSNIVVGRAVIFDISPVTLTLFRWLVGAGLLLAISWRQILRERHVIASEWRMLVVYAVFAISAINILCYYAVRYTTAVNASIVNAVLPILIVIASWILLKDRLTSRQSLGVLISISGVVVVVARGEIHTLLGLHFNPGDLLMFAGVSCWAVYSAAIRRFGTKISPLPFAATIGLLGAIMVLPIYLVEFASGVRFPATWQSFAAIAYIGIFPSALALLLWNRGVREVGANTAGFFTNLIPFYGSVLAILLLGEEFRLFHVAGIALIFGGIYIAVRRPLPENPAISS